MLSPMPAAAPVTIAVRPLSEKRGRTRLDDSTSPVFCLNVWRCGVSIVEASNDCVIAGCVKLRFKFGEAAEQKWGRGQKWLGIASYIQFSVPSSSQKTIVFQAVAKKRHLSISGDWCRNITMMEGSETR